MADAGPSPTFTRSMLAAAIEAHLPGLRLSDTELDDLADATLRMREAQRALRVLPEAPSEAAERAQARRRLETAIVDFHYIAEMSPAEFTRRVGAGADGALRELPPGAHDEVLLRPLAPRPGRP